MKKLLIIPFILVVFLSTPYLFLIWANTTNSEKNIQKFHTLAVKTAFLPSLKARMLIERGDYYFLIEKDGPRALSDYEHAYKNRKCRFLSYCRLSVSSAAILYAMNGDLEKALSLNGFAYNYTGAAVDCILMGKYDSALVFINHAINKNPKNGWNYMTRATIYKNLKKDKLAQSDYKKALDICPEQESEFKKVIGNYRTYCAQKYSKLKKEYKFN